jgi:glutathione S-transferase
MLALYHFPDAICAMKVRIALAEKGLEWESRVVEPRALRSPEYLAINPNGVVPALIHNGSVLIESRIISEYLEDAYPEPHLMPADALGRHRVRLWSKQIDDSLHANIFVLSFIISMRDMFLAMPDHIRDKALPGHHDPIKLERSREMLEKGFESRFAKLALARFQHVMADMETSLANEPWLAGSQYTLADADYTPYLSRLTNLGLSALWQDKPHVTAWFERVKARPSFKQGILDWFTPEDNARFAANIEKAASHIRQWALAA